MKNLILIIAIVSVTSCDFLDETPKDFLSPANFYETEDDAIAAVNAVYDQLGYYGNMWQLGERPSDNLEDGPVGRDVSLELHTFTWNSATGIFGSVWQQLYRSINLANTALEQLPGVEMDENLKSRLIGEVKFLRALNYFDLVRNFGGVPITTSSTASFDNLFTTRNTIDEVYDLIIEDLEDSEVTLPLNYSSNDTGRATRGAAKALLARVLLYYGDFSGAAQKAKEVIDSGEYDLFTNVDDLWKVANENGLEHIFSVQYHAGIQGSGFSSSFAIRGGEPPLTGFSTAIVRQGLLDSFDPSDERRAASVLESYTFPDGTVKTYDPHVWKFYDETAIDPTEGSTNWPVIRYAEVLLIYAEALNENNGGPNQEAYDAINEVRDRAGLNDLPTDLSQAQFRDAALDERRWELCFEGHRYYDLKRMGQLNTKMSVLGITVEEKHQLYPLPLRELDANPNLVQNTDY
ncbi:MAG: RagB/SusD family nutrient uptake outer membrane protein [Cyclobacteriaceae bacterium]|nr:RagB/SusD family nutrient uptake outer membrane protein [Cyclobacteriaceae bacterium SS2]